ncbi:MAG TPA: GIY-YIG nuclease family protein [Candidatus Angelobacter sp.]|jgi:putative endonuclease
MLSSLTGTLYVVLTDNLKRRIREHKLGLFDGFTKRYKIHRLIYFEIFRDAETAEQRERQIKKYRREKKVALFAETNPHWYDLSQRLPASYKEVLM